MTSAFAFLFCNQFAAFIAGHEALVYRCDDNPPLNNLHIQIFAEEVFQKAAKSTSVFWEELQDFTPTDTGCSHPMWYGHSPQRCVSGTSVKFSSSVSITDLTWSVSIDL